MNRTTIKERHQKRCKLCSRFLPKTIDLYNGDVVKNTSDYCNRCVDENPLKGEVYANG